MTRKQILLILILVLIIFGVFFILKENDSKEDINNKQNNINNNIENEEIENIRNQEIVKELEKSGLRVENFGRNIDTNLETEGTLYKVHKEEIDYEIQISQIDINTIRNIGDDIENGEIILNEEKYWIIEDLIIKLTGNNDVDQLIEDTISKLLIED